MKGIYEEKIATNVVNYNKKDLLLECLNALINQTLTLNAIHIIEFNFGNTYRKIFYLTK